MAAKPDFKDIDKEQIKAYNKVFKDSGFDGLEALVMSDISSWKDINIRIAITGNTGSGKSSLVNALRDVNAESEDGALVGVNETTFKVAEYSHPWNKRFIFCDLPGVGTTNFPRQSYFQKIDFSKFDFVIIVSSKRFTDNDIWLAGQVLSRNKQFFFVRTKIGNDVKNNAKGNKKPEDDLLQSIRDDCERSLLQKVENIEIFLVDNYQRHLYDFHNLAERLIEKSEGLQREALVMSFKPVTKFLLDQTKMYFKKRVWKIALLATFAEMFTNTGISVLLKEKKRYIKRFEIHQDPFIQLINEKINQSLDLGSEDANNEHGSDELRDGEGSIEVFPVKNQDSTYKFYHAWLDKNLEEIYQIALDRHTCKK